MSESYFRGRLFGFEIQHIIPVEIRTSTLPAAVEAMRFLQSIGVDLEARGNKIALLISTVTRNAVLNAPATVQSAFKAAGFGFNVHDSQLPGGGGNHPEYNAFAIEALNDLATRATTGNWDSTAKTRAYYDLHSFLQKINADGTTAIIGTPRQTFATLWAAYRDGRDYANLTTEQANVIDRYESGFIKTPIDGADRNDLLRRQVTTELLNRAGEILTPEELANAQKGLSAGPAGDVTAAAVSLIFSLQKRSTTPVNVRLALTEYAAAFIRNEQGSVNFGALYDSLNALFDKIGRYADGFADRLSALGESTIGAMGKSVHAMLLGLGGNVIGDIVEFLNMAYEPIKKGFKTGDWSDLGNTIVQYGAAAVVSAIIVTGSIAATAVVVGAVSATAAPIAAALVAAGWAAYGLYDAITNGAELIGKISADLATIIPKIGETIERGLASAAQAIALMEQVIKVAFARDFEIPNFEGVLQNKYLADTFDISLPARLEGGEGRDRYFGKNNAYIDGGAGNDEIYMIDSSGTAKGGSGNDILVGRNPTYVRAGEYINKEDRDGVAQPHLPEELRDKIVKPIATSDLQLVLDGGEGRDWLVVGGGERAITAGGLGRDWIFNHSNGGIIYGDTISGTYEKPVLDAQGNPILNPDGTPKTTPTQVEDTAANSDNFWYSANTVIKDAQHHDVLKFYGLTLTGGNAEGGIAGLLAFGGVGAAVGMANFYSSLDGNGKYDPAKSVYFDHLFPWMTYVFRPNARGGLDMFVTNQFDQLFTAVFGGTPSETYKAQQALDAQGILKGWMKVENFDLVGSYIGFRQAELTGQGDFGMVFKAVNPIANLMTMLEPLLGIYGIAMAAQYGGNVLIDQAVTLAAAATRFAKGMLWAAGVDPLVIDLDGDGIETTDIATSQVYFDIDGDLFAERTGWLKGDDGFLVRDRNGNGGIDDISEMFGGVGQSGYAQLAALDSNGDGKITQADVLWSELKVWQDYDSDGVTDAGELKTLDQLGIVTLDLGATAIDIVTPQGARLTGFGDVTFESGVIRRMYDAILFSNDTDTKFAGESGRADWQSSSTLDVKGFGRITNLSIAMANDIVFGELVTSTAAAMTTPKIRTLVAQVGDVLGAWGAALEETRELTPVLVGLDGNGKAVLLDRGVYVEDAQGGHWTLASGAPVLDGQAMRSRARPCRMCWRRRLPPAPAGGSSRPGRRRTASKP